MDFLEIFSRLEVYALTVLTTHRISIIITQDNGPFQIFRRLRDKFAKNPTGERQKYKSNWFTCFGCNTVTIGLFVFCLSFLGSPVFQLITSPFWASGLAILYANFLFKHGKM